MRIAYRALLFILIIAAAGVSGGQVTNPIDRITQADLKADLFTLAGDAMRGREGGTIDELNASMWIAERCRAIGLQPAGDNGTYFQFFPIERYRVSASSQITLGGKQLRMGTDVVTDNTVLADVDAPVVIAASDALADIDISGKTLVVRYVRPTAPPALPSLSSPNLASGLRAWLRNIQRTVQARNPAAIVAIVPDAERDQWDRTVYTFPRGTYGLDPDGTAPQRVLARGVPLLYVRESALGAPLAADARLVASIFTESRYLLGRSPASGGLVLSQRSSAVCACRRPGDLLYDAAPSGLPHARRQSRSDRSGEADENDKVDVCDWP